MGHSSSSETDSCLSLFHLLLPFFLVKRKADIGLILGSQDHWSSNVTSGQQNATLRVEIKQTFA